ncbi:hypothetical protein QWA_17860 [Alcaligenes faecalis subsp. faecalis NCIB 8687]|nr:hypothetical protein QWA_17860 [Alcaligenes faecalis subsp. faecalis NCIB 8687]
MQVDGHGFGRLRVIHRKACHQKLRVGKHVLPDQIAEKAQGCEMVARVMEADLPAIDAEIRRLQDLKKARKARADALRFFTITPRNRPKSSLINKLTTTI